MMSERPEQTLILPSPPLLSFPVLIGPQADRPLSRDWRVPVSVGLVLLPVMLDD